MAGLRNVFFSHHYDDADLVQQIIGCDRFRDGPPRFRNWRAWEEVRLRDRRSIERWIDGELEGSSVTVVLIGEHTWSREWVKYEIEQSVAKRNGLLGIYLDQMEGIRPHHRGYRPRGLNPFQSHPPRPSINELANMMARGGLLGIHDPQPSAGGGLLGINRPEPNPRNALAGLLAQSGMFGATPGVSRAAQRGIIGSAMGPQSLGDQIECYCWEEDRGIDNFDAWIEKAAADVGR